jgi:bifunctional DNA-binding transcriptional regulator/antitoxin component of YhaV-PrlF toxin-antitoxin module
MEERMTLQIVQRGLITLPKPLRDAYRLKSGDELTLLDLGGVFVLSPRTSKVDALTDQIAQSLAERGESLESMLQALREAREEYDPGDGRT